MRIAQAALHVLAHAGVALAGQRVPHVDGRVPVPAAHDGRITRIEVLYVLGQRYNVALAGDDNATWHGRANKFVAGD